MKTDGFRGVSPIHIGEHSGTDTPLGLTLNQEQNQQLLQALNMSESKTKIYDKMNTT